MGLFTAKVVCDVCGAEFKRWKSDNDLSNGVFCNQCRYKILWLTVEELNQMTVQDIKIIIESEKLLSQNPLSEIYDVTYLGGYPNHNEVNIFNINLILYNDYLRILTTIFRDFKPITIYYKDIKDIKMADSFEVKRRIHYLEKERVIQIDFYYNDTLMTMQLDILKPNQKKKKILYNELFSLISTSGIRDKFRKEIEEPQISAADEILKFKNLLDMGIITQEEFEKKKQQLLGL